ncbi:MAG TPA: PAS domain S-box protein [Rubricoccaceae bacterium]
MHVRRGRGRPFVVGDARLNARLQGNPSVREFGVRAYLGVPVRSPDGHVLGSLCGLDVETHAWTADDEATLCDIAASVEAEVALRAQLADLSRSASGYRALFEGASDAILVFDPTTETVLDANPQAATLYGYDRGELVGMTLAAFSTDAGPAGGAVGRLLDGGAEPFESVQRRRDGTPVHVTISAQAVRVGGRVAVLSIHRDVTAQREGEAALRESRAHVDRLALVAERTTNGVVVTDAEGRTEWVNAGLTRITGYTLDELRGRKPGALLQGPETDPATVDRIREHVARREPFTAEIVNHHRDGAPYWIRLEATPILDDDGTFRGFMAIESDVTDRKRAEAALRDSEAQFRLFAETAGDVIVTVDAASRVLYVNPACESVFGYTADELVGRDLSVLVPDRFHEAHRAGRAVETGQRRLDGRAVEVPGRRRDGTEVPLSIAFGEYVRDGAHVSTSIMRDVSAQKAVEDALRASEARYRSVVETVRDAVVQADMEGRWAFLNPAWETMTGFPVAESLGRPSVEFVHPDERDRHEDTFAPLLAGRVPFVRFESRYVTRDGGFRHVEVHAQLARDEGGAVTGTTGTVTDITDTVRFEAEREARGRTEEMLRLKDAFLNNMSHELRTPLTGILGYAELLADEVGEEHREPVEVIVRSAHRLQETLNSVLDLAQLESGTVRLRAEPLDVLAEARDVLAVLAPVAKRQRLALDVVGDSVLALADRPALHRVLYNLVGNALKFTPAGGVRVSVEGGGGRVRLRVADTGIGIAAEFVPRLFDEFTQASEGYARTHEGNGLGLSITHRLVGLMGGTLAVESVPGAGTTFTVDLPAAVPVAVGPAGGLVAA